jgi:hypothetical protein
VTEQMLVGDGAQTLGIPSDLGETAEAIGWQGS